MMPGDEAEIIVCAGPPLCLFQDDEAIEAATAGCPYCRHIVMRADGGEDEFQRQAH
jgi:hypothetical protein